MTELIREDFDRLALLIRMAGRITVIAMHFCSSMFLREARMVRAGWAAHGIHNVYLPLSIFRRVCERVIPGADVRRHLLGRYSIVWKK